MSANLMGLGENPFAAGHDPRLVYSIPERAEFLARARDGLSSGEPFLMLTGEAGIGKTSVLSEMLADPKIWAALITNPRLTPAELLEEVGMRFGADPPAAPSKPQILACLERHLGEIRREGIAVLVIDEAHDLSPELLEELRLLSNFESNGKPLLQIVLVGLPELEARLAQPAFQQLRQRIAVEGRLHPLGAEDTERYVHHRVAAAGGDGAERFPRETCLEIHRLTRGVPRAINTLAGLALLAASRESERTVTVAHVQAAVADTWLRNADGAPATGDAPSRRGSNAAATESHPQGAEPASGAATADEPAPIADSAATLEAPAAMIGTVIEPRRSTDPGVRAWVSRFVDPDKPLQIGAQALLAPGLTAELSDADFGIGSASEGEAGEDLLIADAGDGPGARPVGRRGRRRRPAPRRRHARRDSRWITIAAAGVLVVAAGVVLVPRLPIRTGPSSGSSASSASATIPPPPAAQLGKAAANRADSPRERRAAAPSKAAPGHSSAPTHPSPRAAGAVAPPVTTAAAGAEALDAPKHWQGIEVGTYIDPYRASAERDRLAGLTGLSGRVLQTGGQGAETYHVVIGSFSTSGRAERTADRLISQGKIDQAQIVPLGAMKPPAP